MSKYMIHLYDARLTLKIKEKIILSKNHFVLFS